MEAANNLRGIYRDVVTAGDGTILRDSGWQSNQIVERCRILLAGFMLNGTTSGIQYLQVGRGNDDWDRTGALPPRENEKELDSAAVDTPIPFSDFDVAYLTPGGTTIPITDRVHFIIWE